jgi:hypothetical protein
MPAYSSAKDDILDLTIKSRRPLQNSRHRIKAAVSDVLLKGLSIVSSRFKRIIMTNIQYVWTLENRLLPMMKREGASSE